MLVDIRGGELHDRSPVGFNGHVCGGPEHTAGDESGGPETQISLGAESVFGSNADECAASGAGSIHPSSEGTACSGRKYRVVAGAMFRILSDCRSRSCTS